MEKESVDILDCTLRDGSYLIDYQFTAEDTYIICLGLQRAGFRLIEIGHGTGLGSSEAGKGMAAATDEEYLKAAKSAVEGSEAKFGMFFIPGIGKMEDLKMAAEFGMGFVRIGTNVTEIDKAKPYIEKAKEFGMEVASNLMKSYAVSLDEFVRLAKKADKFGADVITVVDSAGGMLPHEVREYVLRLRDVTDRGIGFHGHNNLQLAIANTLEAVKAGARIVDSSLQGMGRSAGNAQTEVLAMVLEKLGYCTGLDTYKAMDIGERIIKPMMTREQGVDDISLVSGIAQFHSSFYNTVCDAAKKYQIDPRRLIIEVSEIDRVNITKELAEATALRIKNNMQERISDSTSITINTNAVRGKESRTLEDRVRLISNEIISQSKKTGKESVFSITVSKIGQTSFPFIRQSSSFVIGNAEVSDLHEVAFLIKSLDGNIKWLLLDESCSQLRKSGFDKDIQKSIFTWYSEARVLHLSICTILSQKIHEGTVLILSDEENANLMKLSLKQQGISITTSWEIKQNTGEIHKLGLNENDNSKKLLGQICAVVSFGIEYTSELTDEYMPFLVKNITIYLATPHIFETSFWNAALKKGITICRIDARAAFAAEISLVIETKKMIDVMGSKLLSGIPVVAGGIIGSRGSVVVDSAKNPTRVIGLADGLGGLLRTEEEIPFKAVKEKIREQLIKNLYKKEY